MTGDVEVPRPLVILTGVVFVAGCSALVIAAGRHSLNVSFYLVLMAVAAVLSEHFAPVIRGHGASITFPLAVAAMALQGPVAAAVVGGPAAIRSDSLKSRRMVVITFFNLGQYLLIFTLAGLIYAGLGGPILDGLSLRQFRSADFPAALLPMIATVVFCAAANVAVTAAGISAAYGVNIRNSLSDTLPYGGSLVALGLVGYLMAQVVTASVFALPLFLFPLILARQIYQRYADLDDAYIDTIRSLVSAMEAKDPYTKGHSERVAQYAVALGQLVGRDDRELETLEKSALLHDIGKIALSSQLLTKPSRLTEQETALMREHPQMGATMVGRILPLKGLSVLIASHHERYDGGGYPAGVVGEATPLLARILAVADAYDAMTTNRAYRPAMSAEEALTELYAGAGTQFDPELVRLFADVVGITSREDSTADHVAADIVQVQAAR